MSKSQLKSKRKRVYISRKRYNKIHEHAIKEGLVSGAHIIDELMYDFIEKEGL